MTLAVSVVHGTSPIPKDRNAVVLLELLFSVRAQREGCHLLLLDVAFSGQSGGRAPHSPSPQPASTAQKVRHGPRSWDRGSALATWAFRTERSFKDAVGGETTLRVSEKMHSSCQVCTIRSNIFSMYYYGRHMYYFRKHNIVLRTQ